MTKEVKERSDLSLDKLSVALKNPPQDVFVSVYTKKRVEVETVRHRKDKITLSGLAVTVNDLSMTVNNLSTTVNDLSMTVSGLVKTVNNLSTTVNDLSMTVSGLVKTVNNLAKRMNEGFKQVNTRIDNIEKRLDYNKLKPLPKEAR